jgi:phosphinothricin acetyltransferase
MSGDPRHPLVRRAVAEDASACVAIYAPYVCDTAITFETEVPTVAEMAARIAAAQATHEWLVAEVDGDVIGYAYAREFKQRAAYRWSVETSVYMSARRRRTGGGRVLYAELLRRLAERGYRRAFAGITQPNDASIDFHRAVGFEPVGRYLRVGWKLDGWHDVAWMQLDLLPPEREIDPPAEVT